MPRNIELKARVASLDTAREIAQRIATQDVGALRQIDTYFHVPRGRLKLREIVGQGAELIAYHRSDAAHARGSDYHLVPIADPPLLKQALSATLGVRIVVDKIRHVLLYDNVRVHLDSVQGVGEFLEFESVLGGEIDDAAGRAQLDWLSREFRIASADIVPQSYSDLLELASCSPAIRPIG